MKKSLLSFCSFFIYAAAALAQISFGPEIGINVSNYYGKTAGIKQTFTTSIPGARLGGIADIGFSRSFSLQPGLFYVRNGYNVAATDIFGNKYMFNFRAGTIELPVNLLYKIGRRDGNKLFFGLGPYAGANVGGHIKSELLFPGTRALSIGSALTDDIKMFDLGLGVCAGFQLPSGFLIHVHYQHSLVNLQPGGDADNTMNNVNYGVSLGYLFGRHARSIQGPDPEKKKK